MWGTASLPRINNQAHKLWMLEVDFPDDPMEDSLASPICRHRERAYVHSANTSHGTPDPDELRPFFLLQQRKRGLEEEQRAVSIDINMFLNDRGITGSERCKVVADACVSDDEVKINDSLLFDRGYGVGGIGLGFVVDFNNEEFAGRIFGNGGELLRRGVFGIADTSDDGGRRAREVGLDEAEADACEISSFERPLGETERKSQNNAD